MCTKIFQQVMNESGLYKYCYHTTTSPLSPLPASMSDNMNMIWGSLLTICWLLLELHMSCPTKLWIVPSYLNSTFVFALALS